MASERKIRRYAAYFHGWATAFGHHDKHFNEGCNLTWLFGNDQIGLILTPGVKDFLDPLFPAQGKSAPPDVMLGPDTLQIADTRVRLGEESRRELDAVMDLLDSTGDLHLLQTYHLVYPSGTRILTLSRQQPLTLIYREIEPLHVRMI